MGLKYKTITYLVIFFKKGTYVRLLSFPFHVVPPAFLSLTSYSLIAADATAMATVPF